MTVSPSYSNVGDHDYIFLSFDLYIHGSWDGNANGFDNNDKADKWIMEYKPNMDLYKGPEFDRFETTFSNSPCWPNYCLFQSYPESFPFLNNPKTGVFLTDLPRKCPKSFFGGPTSLIKLKKDLAVMGTQ